MKHCKKCNQDKSITEFWKNKTTADGLQAWCKPCWYALTKSKLEGKDRERYLRMRRNGHLVRKYGITADEYDEMLSKQSGGCGICGRTFGRIRLAVDHDHKTGKIRGILCENCNMGLGMFKDDTKLLSAAIEYLE